MLLVTFHTFRGLAAEVGRMSERLAVETLSVRLGVLKFLPSDYAVAQFVKLKYFMHVGSQLESDHKYWVLGYHCSCRFVHFSDLSYLHSLCVVCCQLFSDVFFRDVWGNTLEY